MKVQLGRIAAGALVLVLVGAACSTKTPDAATSSPPAATDTPATTTDTSAKSPAATLRANLNVLLSEHVALAAAATGAALSGRTAAYNAAAGVLLGKNTDDLTAAIQSVYGDGAAEQFKALWKKHIGFVVDYTSNFGKKAKQDKAVADLIQYTKDFGAFLGSATGLPTDAVAELVKGHILSLKSVIDAQQAKNYAKAYTDLATAMGHMDMIAGALAGAISTQNPTKVPGDAKSKASDLHSTLDSMFSQHVVLAAAATGAALGGRTAEYSGAAGVLLGKNTDDLTAAIQSVYGDGAAEQFKALWKKHIGFVVDYTSNFGKKAKQDKAVADLIQYTKDFGAFLGSATGLPTDAVAELVKGHILSLKSVIDAQQAKKFGDAYSGLVEAVGHMDMIGGGLADAIAKQKGL